MAIAARPCSNIATLTGGRAITEDLGIKLENIKIEDLGKAKKVTIDKDNTTIVEGGGNMKDIEGRVKQIRVQVEETTSTTIVKLRSGWRSYVGGVAVIKVGAGHRDRDEGEGARRRRDARDQGGGRRRHRCRRRRRAAARGQRRSKASKLESDQKVGAAIIKRAIEEPMRWIASNAGEEGSIVVVKVQI